MIRGQIGVERSSGSSYSKTILTLPDKQNGSGEIFEEYVYCPNKYLTLGFRTMMHTNWFIFDRLNSYSEFGMVFNFDTNQVISEWY